MMRIYEFFDIFPNSADIEIKPVIKRLCNFIGLDAEHDFLYKTFLQLQY
jgi:hypothetical protein